VNIIVAFDGSKVARKAVRLAKKHAEAFDGRVIIVTSMKGGPEVPRREFERAEKQLQSEEAALKEAGIACETVLSVRGMEPGEDLVQMAEEKKAEEIILGIQKKSKVGKLLFGSTVQYVILNAACPVVTVS
jgi:nucleotide-binding universal stress UspA family protein